MSEHRYEAKAKAARKWWTELGPKPAVGDQPARPGDRASLAQLRRADNLLEAASVPATIELFRELQFDRRHAARDLPRAALVAAVLAHVREDNRSHPVASAIGQLRAGTDSTALITPLRFKRIVAARTPGDLLVRFRRVVAIMDKTANVKDLARQLLAFTDPDHDYAERARVMFAFAYHGAEGYAPNADPASATEPATA
ncbi:MAG: type I-E CRISPR-associated protein Cse2/CasB [Pseudomonadota bacterium]